MAASSESSRSESAKQAFDPYYKWLGIPASEQPPHHYRLLALAPFEADGDVIEAAADRQMGYVKQLGAGPHSTASQKLLNELSAARVTLLDRAKKAAYDQELRTRLASATSAPILLAKPAAAPVANSMPAPAPKAAAARANSSQPVLLAAAGLAALVLIAGIWAIRGGGEGGDSPGRAAEINQLAATPSKDVYAAAKQIEGPAQVAAAPSRPRSSSAKPRPKKPAQQIAIAEARYGKPEANLDLTERMQQAAQEGLLVVFVEPFLAEGKFSGELYLRGQLGKQPFEQKFNHRQFVFLDARPAPKPPKKGLAVLDAFYGAGIWGEGKMVDAKTFLNEREKGGRIDVTVKELVAKIPDPAPGTSKALIVRYALDGETRLAIFEEHQTVRLGARPLPGAQVRVFRTELSDQVHLRPTGGVKFVQSFLADVTPGEGLSSSGYASSTESPESQRLRAQTQADENGKFHFADLAADEAWTEQRAVVLVVVQAPGKGTQCERAMIARRADVSPFVDEMQFTLPAAVSLRGRVVDSDGKPVADAVISCPDACALARPLPGIMCAVTDADGRYEIADLPPFDVDNLPPQVLDFGTFARISAAVGIEHADYAPQVAEYERLPAMVDATLQRPATLTGQILDEESGQPAAMSTVRWTHERGFSDATLTDQDGRYAATGLPPGKYALRAWRSDRLDFSREVELHSGPNSADLRLQSGAFIQGIVIDEATGKPPLEYVGDMQMSVHAMLPGEKPSEARAGYVQRDGTFSMTVRPGKNSLVFFHPRWRLIDEASWRERGVEAAKGQTAKVELRVALQRPAWTTPAGAAPAAGFALPKQRLSGKALIELLKATGYVQLQTETIDGREAVTEIALGAPYEIDFEALAPQLAWLYENLLANLKEFSELRSLTLYPPRGCDETLEALRELKKLESLTLADTADLTAAGAAHLDALPKLKELALVGPGLDDSVLRQIARLSKLESLMFGGAFTDVGLAQLRGCTHLKQLQLAAMDGGRLTDRGLESLSGLTNLVHLSLVQMDEDGPSRWNVTDAGLLRLRGLKELQQLELGSSAVTEAGIAELKRALPNLKVTGFGDK